MSRITAAMLLGLLLAAAAMSAAEARQVGRYSYVEIDAAGGDVSGGEDDLDRDPRIWADDSDEGAAVGDQLLLETAFSVETVLHNDDGGHEAWSEFDQTFGTSFSAATPGRRPDHRAPAARVAAAGARAVGRWAPLAALGDCLRLAKVA